MIDPAKPERAQVMKIAGAIKNERRKVRAGLVFEFFIKSFDQTRRRAETKFRPPGARIEGRQMQHVLDEAKAPCWSPDPPSQGTCQVK